MKKLTPILLLAAMLFLLIVSWVNVLTFFDKHNAEYALHIENAKKFESKEIYIDAVSEYEAALSLEPDNYSLAMTIVELYQKLEQQQGVLNACRNAISADKTQWEPYRLIADYYIEGAMYSKAYSILHEAQLELGNTSEIRERIISIMKNYTELSIKYDEIKSFHYKDSKSNGYAMVKLDGKVGILTDSNSVKYKCIYEDIGFLSENVIPVKQNGEYYYIDENGYRKLVPDETADYLGTFSGEYAPAAFNGVYGYIDKSMKQYLFEYSYAGPFSNGIAAVKKDNRWAIINSSLTYITDFTFDDILLDDYGYCTENGYFFAKKNGEYFLYNKEGNCISEGFEDAKMFVSNEPAAVKKKGKWGFISTEGKFVIEPKFEDACSYNVGYAPFKSGDKWGYMDSEGEMIIEPKFDRLDAFSKKGYAYAEIGGEKKFVVVTIYE